MNSQEFANKIRAKYPGSYDNIDDDTLARKVVEKYPVYADKVSFGVENPSLFGKLASPQSVSSTVQNTADAINIPSRVGRSIGVGIGTASEATGIPPNIGFPGGNVTTEQIHAMMHAAKNPGETLKNIAHAAVRGYQALQPGYKPKEKEQPYAQIGEMAGNMATVAATGGAASGLGGVAQVAADTAIAGGTTAITQAQSGRVKVLPNPKDQLSSIKDFISSPSFKSALNVLPDSIAGNAAIPATSAAIPKIVEAVRDGIKSVSLKIFPSLFKGTAGIPQQMTEMAIKDPEVLSKLQGTQETVSKKVNDVIDSVQKARLQTGESVGSVFKKYAGMDSPVDEILDQEPSYQAVFGKRTYETLGEDIQKTNTIPGRTYQVLGEPIQKTNSIPAYSYKTAGTTENFGINPREITGQSGGENVNIPGRSYTYLEGGPSKNVSVPSNSYQYSEQGPNKNIAIKDVIDVSPKGLPSRSFEDIKADWKSAKDGTLFRKYDSVGAFVSMSNQEKLAVLTRLKREANQYANYFKQVGINGSGATPIDSAMSTAAKRIAHEISNESGSGLRDALPNGKKLMVADSAWSGIHDIYNTIQKDLSDPGKAQDAIMRLIKGDVTWLTGGRMAQKLAAIRRVEQLTGTNVLDAAMKEMSAASFKQLYGKGLAPHLAVMEGMAAAFAAGGGNFKTALATLPLIAAGSPRIAGEGIRIGRRIGQMGQTVANYSGNRTASLALAALARARKK